MKLAINGGKKIRNDYFPSQKTINEIEIEAVNNFFKNKTILSGYRGNATKYFWGGDEVKKVESKFENIFNTKALAVNSCTSALQIACAAIELKQGDEVIVTPWSMCCSASAPLLFGAIPVFADLDENYCISYESVKNLINEKTKAIIVVDLFGNIYDQRITKLAKEKKIFIIEDAAQAIGSKLNNQYAGTFGDIGCFSFTQGKLLTCGEGGMIVTKNQNLYEKCSLMRNHTESILHDSKRLAEKYKDFNYPGFNMRMTEIQAVILNCQLDKLTDFIQYRNINSKTLANYLRNLQFLDFRQQTIDINSQYVFPFIYDQSKIGIHRNIFIDAVKAELTEEHQRIDRGIPIGKGYLDPLYNWQIFNKFEQKEKFEKVNKFHNDLLVFTMYHGLNLEKNDINDIADAFVKVYENIDELQNG